MSEILFYTGIVLSIFFFILSILLFFMQNTAEAISFYISRSKRNKYKTNEISNTSTYSSNQISSEHDTMLLENDKTQLLNIAQNYATTLLEAEMEENILTESKDIEHFQETFTLSSANKIFSEMKK